MQNQADFQSVIVSRVCSQRGKASGCTVPGAILYASEWPVFDTPIGIMPFCFE